MLQIRHLIRPLVVVALLATALALAATSPAGAQSTIRVFTFGSGEDGSDADDWEIQITVQALGGCNPPNARPGYVTSWIGAGDEDGDVLDPGVCNYRITAVARKSETPSQLCNATVRWGTSGTYKAALTTSDSDRNNVTIVQAEHTGGTNPSCSAQPTLSISINPDDIIQELPDSAKDSNLTERAERAAEITEFRVNGGARVHVHQPHRLRPDTGLLRDRRRRRGGEGTEFPRRGGDVQLPHHGDRGAPAVRHH